jgi:hypothetical protein
MLDHIVELLGFLGMALLHGRYDVYHSTPGLRCSQMPARAKKSELSDIAIIKAYATPIRSAVFPDF